ncbi:MAG TPA: small acid-soluble spore protein SspI [Chondromyces sp.]|nr:small acid-soluble spore protein SspI [Chondromyces sp.]
MNFDLRNAVLNNVSGSTEEDLKNTIVDAIQRGEEKMLPGLGVLFEVFWKNASNQEQNTVLETMAEGLKQ